MARSPTTSTEPSSSAAASGSCVWVGWVGSVGSVESVAVPLVPLGWVEDEGVVSSVDGRASPWLAAPPFILMTSCAPSFEPPLK